MKTAAEGAPLLIQFTSNQAATESGRSILMLDVVARHAPSGGGHLAPFL